MNESLRRVTAAEMKELDRRAIEEFGIPSLTLMENAGKAVAVNALGLAGGLLINNPRFLAVCGSGNNGGDALVAARYLAAAGNVVQVLLLCSASQLKGDALTNYKRLLMAEISCEVCSAQEEFVTLNRALNECDFILDGIFGVGLSRELSPFFRDVIGRINGAGKKVIAIDVPSGVNADDGSAYGALVRADLTLTLGLPKTGLYHGEGSKMCGEIRVLDIGLPREIL